MADAVKYKLKDLIDIPKLQALLDALDEIHSLPSAIIDTEGVILTATAWQDICTKFHRVNPEAAKKCAESDSYIARELDKNPPNVVYKCPMGLVDTATPIIVEGIHLGNVFTGQLFIEHPDEARFIRQARQYGFNEQDYLAALNKVPIVTEKRLRKNLKFLGRFTEMLAHQGLQHKRQLDIEEALRDAGTLNRQVIHNVQEGVIVYGCDLRYRVWNPYMERFSGLTADAVLGRRPLELFPFLKDAGVIERLEQALAGRNPDPLEFQFLNPQNGRSGWASDISAPFRNSNGDIIGVIATVRDVTAHRRAVDERRADETKFRAVFENSRDAIGISKQGINVFANPAYLKLFGFTSHEQLVGRSILDSIAPSHRQDILSRMRRRAEGEPVPSSYETRGIRTDGTEFDFEIIVATFEQLGQTFTLANIRDITDRRNKERQIEEKNAELERFTYAVSHDLKSPLVTISTFLGYLERDLATNDLQRTAADIEFMRKAADKMALLLNELLVMSRIGRIVNEPVRVAFRELAKEASNAVAGRIVKQRVKVHIEEAALELTGDRQRFAEIWQNLIENSVKYMGGQIDPRIEIGADQSGTDVIFFVRDNGMGIDPRHQEKIFGLFDKLDPKSEGSGLGLTLVKRIVELYKGRIWVESEGVGKGCCFRFTLPGAMVN